MTAAAAALDIFEGFEAAGLAETAAAAKGFSDSAAGSTAAAGLEATAFTRTPSIRPF